jgi:acetylornithine deacetylase
MGAEDLLAALVALPTVAGEPNRALVEFLRDTLAGSGAKVTVIPSPRAGAANVLATVGPRDVPGIVLAAHTDVVAVAGQSWATEPFALVARDGRLHGRGTADMKGFVAAALAVVTGIGDGPLRRPVHLALSCDEELGCRGVGPLLDTLAALPAPRLCVVGEPTMLDVATRHKGKVALRVRVRGRAAHSSAVTRGVNAVEDAARLISALDGVREVAAGERDDAFDVPHATLSVGRIAGGGPLNVVPDRCTFELELRTLPCQDPEPLLALVRDAARRLRAGVAFEELARYPGLAADPAGRPAAELVAGLAGGRAGLAVDFGTEAGLYQERLRAPVVVCGPGSMAHAHGPDEYLEADQLARTEELLRRLVDHLAR